MLTDMVIFLKYEFTDETLAYRGHILHRIRALYDFGVVRAGEVGGWIEKEKNLSHDDNCWVADNAKVYDEANVLYDAVVYEHACVYGSAKIFGYAKIYGNARVRGSALIYDYAMVYDNAIVCDVAWVYDRARIYDNAEVRGSVNIGGNTEIRSSAEVRGSAHVSGNAKIENTSDIFAVGPIGSRDDFTTFYRTKTDAIGVTCGCFRGLLEDFAMSVEKKHGDDGHGVDYRLAIELAKNRFMRKNEIADA